MRQNDLKKVSRLAPSGEADARQAVPDDSFIKKRRALDVETIVLAAAVVVAAVFAPDASAAEQLPALGADLSATSVSGLSSIEVAHSSQIVGAGIVAGGPFACAETEASKLVPFWPMAVAQNAQQALHKCMKTTLGVPDPKVLAERAKELAGDGRSTLSPELASDNVYLFSGNEDQTVERRVVEAARHFLEEVGVPETNINLVEKQGGHAFITEQGGATCGITAKPYVSNCNYGQAKAILAWIYGPLQDAAPEPRGQFIVFDQQTFARPDNGFAEEGVVYIAPPCGGAKGLPRPYRTPRLRAVARGGRRRVHQGIGLRPDRRYEQVHHPLPPDQSERDQPSRLLGLVGLDYLGKDAPQIAAIWAMVEQLAKSP